MKKLIFPMFGAWIASVVLTGCVFAIDSQKPPPPAPVVQSTKGQQLVDLKKAHDAGAITDAEYEVQKEKVLQGK